MIKKTADLREHALADWLEGELILGDADELSVAEIMQLLTDDLGAAGEWDEALLGVLAGPEEAADAIAIAAEDAEVQDDELALWVELAKMELIRRQQTCGDRYPIVVEDELIRMAAPKPDRVEYAFLVALNLRRSLGLAEVVEHHRAAVLFERLVATSLAKFLGGEARRFGVPLAPAIDGFTGDFPTRAQQLADALGELRRTDLPTVSAHQQDYGLDVVAWKRLDGRHGSVVVLCQCGIGGDWSTKSLPRHRWNEVIMFPAWPMNALAFPFLITLDDDVAWDALAVDAGLLLDRLRIGCWADIDEWEGLRPDIVDWLNDVVPLFQAG